mmetsp:Transcript_12348/g.18296  ORF Transcript_12348/g.18296 Transcript_12348/m.18296 type:complete len:106 (-) Transcript_12348:622-939(-)
MAASQEEIVLSLVQGSEGKSWASQRFGWSLSSPEPGGFLRGNILMMGQDCCVWFHHGQNEISYVPNVLEGFDHGTPKRKVICVGWSIGVWIPWENSTELKKHAKR